MKISLAIVLFSAYFLLTFSVSAQNSSLVITADNIRQLHSVSRIDFVDWKDQVGKIENGWFNFNRDGSRLIVTTRNNEIVVGDDAGNIIDHYSVPSSDNLPAAAQDAAFRKNDSAVVSAHTEGGAYYVAYRNYETHETEYFRFDTSDVPLRIWDTGSTWLEISPADYTRGRYVENLKPSESNNSRINAVLSANEVTQFDSGPENDPDAFLRIGRISMPFAITSTQDFLIKRWNLETDEVTATAQLDELPGAGQLSSDGRYFAWRDGDSKALHLLDFETGKDRIIASLRGEYLPFLLLNSSASVIISVNIGLKSVVTAWDTQTGERVELGDYRPCSRQPDMVRLSYDSTTLLIGCDKGLDLWRVS